MLVLAVVVALALLILIFVALHYARVAKRAKIKTKALTPEQVNVLRSQPSWELLNEAEKEKWQQHINVFLDEKKLWNSQTKKPLDLKNMTKVAAWACLPLINRKTNYYGHISDIYYDPETERCSNAAEEIIEWTGILYGQFCQEVSRESMNRDEFVQKSKSFLKGELDSAELKKFYKLNLRSSST